MAYDFKKAVQFVIDAEGGYTDDPNDAGNWTGGSPGKGTLVGTKFGLSAAAYPGLDIRNLTLDDAVVVYHRDYWVPSGADSLPWPLALCVFDAAVNNGKSRAREWLSAALRAAQTQAGIAVDGVLGPQTTKALQLDYLALRAAVLEFQARRTYFFLAVIPDRQSARYGLGWSRRLVRVTAQAALALESFAQKTT